MNQPIELSLEQQFSLRSFETQVSRMNEEQAKYFLVELYKQSTMKDAVYKRFLKEGWHINPDVQPF